MMAERIVFSLNGDEFIPLCDLLKRVGVAQTGGAAKMLISDSLVFVNDVVETRKRYKVRASDRIRFEDTIVEVTA